MKTKRLRSRTGAGSESPVVTGHHGIYELQAFNAGNTDAKKLEESLASLLSSVKSQTGLEHLVEQLARLTSASALYLSADLVTEMLKKYCVSAKEVRVHGQKEKRFPVDSYLHGKIVFSYTGRR